MNEIGFSYLSFNKNISDEIKDRIDFQHDYMLGFTTEVDEYSFLCISDSYETDDDVILASFGWTDKDIIIEMITDMVDDGRSDFLDEFEDVKSVEEFITKYPYQAIDDLVFYYGMQEFECGYGEVWHEIKIKDLDVFIKKYI